MRPINPKNLKLLQTDKQQLPKAKTKFESASDATSYAKTVVGGTENLKPSEQKVLGLKWNYESNKLSFTFDKT